MVNSPRQQNIFNPYWLRVKLTFPFSNPIIGNSQAGILAYHAPLRKVQLSIMALISVE